MDELPLPQLVNSKAVHKTMVQLGIHLRLRLNADKQKEPKRKAPVEASHFRLRCEGTCEEAAATVMLSVVVALPFKASDEGLKPQLTFGEDVVQDRSTMALNWFKEDKFRSTVPELPVLTSTCGR